MAQYLNLLPYSLGFSFPIKINLMTRGKNESYEAMEDGSEAHWEVVQRILFLYAKLNPGLGYVQGMNEIIGPIYYVMASDPLADNRSMLYTARITNVLVIN